jgi:glycosyltransferase involved in cell wall biosynthesis
VVNLRAAQPGILPQSDIELRMRIAIDTHAIGSKLTGNERYIENIVEQLLRLDGENEYFFFFTNEDARRKWQDRARNLKTELVSHNPWIRLCIDLPAQLRRLQPSIFHYQYTGPLFRVGPEVVTVHDVSFERYPEFFSPAQRYRLKLTVCRAVRTAERIITVSEFSKREIVELFGVPEKKVKVIYNGAATEFGGIDDETIKGCLERYSVRKPYLLAVGNISRRKNHLTMVRGFARWLARNPDSDHRLILAGKASDAAKDVLREAARLGLGDNRLRILGYVREGDIACLYAGAELLLNTSFYEGFGLPLIEAMSARVPVVASYASCFPEIAADAARWVNPAQPEEVAAAIDDILRDRTIRDGLVARGLRRARCFRWDTAARETLKVYYEVFQGRRIEGH